MIQALAYCALVENQMNVPVPYALIIYAGQQVRKVEFTEVRASGFYGRSTSLKLRVRD
jgi:hypothetical protein